MRRESWIDSCRFLAIFVIMFTHFLAMYHPSALSLWEGGPSWWLLGGLTGKFSVAFFFVLLGYFASKPKPFGIAFYGSYCARRYFQFAFYVFCVTFFYLIGSYAVTWLFHTPDEYVFHVLSDGPRYNLIYLLHDAFLFRDNYNATLWCMPQLFLASLVCRALGCLPENWRPFHRLAAALAVMLFLMLINGEFCIWICVAILGYLLRLCLAHFQESAVFQKRWPLILVALASVVCIKAPLPEGIPLYALEGLGAFGLLLVQFHLEAVQKWLAKPPGPWLGGISMGLFVVHTPINSLLCSSFYPLLSGRLPQSLVLTLLFFVSLGLCILCAWLLQRAYTAVSRRFIRVPTTV